MINIAGLDKNDFVNGDGVCVSLFLQGCPFHCQGCHNPETWNPMGGEERHEKVLIYEIIEAIAANGIQRNLSILGGEPIDTDEKREFLTSLILEVKKYYPNIKIFMWTGYQYEDIKNDENLQYILDNLDILIDGPFELEERDITLWLRGSRNQRVIDMKSTRERNEVIVYV